MKRSSLVPAALVLAFVVTAAAQDKKTAFADPEQTPASYQIQGEYSGDVDKKDGPQKHGVQIIALGEPGSEKVTKFRAVGYPGGLPGDGWDGENRIVAESELDDDGSMTFTKGDFSGTYQNGKIVITGPGNKELGTLKKVRRKSPTLGKKPPTGAVVLFDGSTAEHFKGGKLTEDGLLQQGVTSKQKFDSFTIHIEFRLPYMPYARGQGRGNSGYYAQGRYEVQMLDSFGLDGKNNECGGIYGVREPDVNMCFPPLTWQTYDIDFTAAKFDDAGKKTENARMTVRHNGVVIHDNVELPNSTRAAPVKEGPQPGPVYLQNHGNPVRYRNIWVVEKK